MAILENDYAAYIQTPEGEVPLRDLDAQEKISSLSEDSYNTSKLLDESLGLIFDKNWVSMEPIQTFEYAYLSGLDKSEEKYKKAIIDVSANEKTHVVNIFKVQGGVTYKVKVSTCFAYIGLGVVFVNSKEIPKKFDLTDKTKYDILDGVDYYLGNNEAQWSNGIAEILSPKTAKYMLLHGLNNNPVGESNIPNEESRKFASKEDIKNFVSKDELTGFSNSVYEISSEPSVSSGTISKQYVYSRYNKPCFLWEFNQTGEITINNIKLNATSKDRVGVWIYINEVACDYRNSTDGVFQILIDGVKDGDDILCAYTLASGWNYVPISILDNTEHNVKFKFTMVRGNYKFAVDTFEINYIPKVKPQILLSFDMAAHSSGNVCNDNRYDLIKQYGFVATFCNPDATSIAQEDRDKVFLDGWDWAIYDKADSSDMHRPDWATGTVDEWKEYIKTHIDSCEKIGLFEPFSYFSPDNRATPNLEKALRELGFKVARIAGSSGNAVNLVWFDDYNNLYINCLGVGGSTSAETILESVDRAIENNSSICIFNHNVEDTLTDQMNTTVAVYSEILEGIKDRVDKGLCEVSTFTDFFRKWCPESCTKKLELRHEKEKQYIISKIGTI